jgi:transposase
LGKRGFHRRQALIEREPGRARMPGQDVTLLDRRVETEPKCRVPGHLTDERDRAAFAQLLRRAKRAAPTITHIWVDNGHTGSPVGDAAAKAAVTLEVVSGPKPDRGFIVQPRRWVVERTNG